MGGQMGGQMGGGQQQYNGLQGQQNPTSYMSPVQQMAYYRQQEQQQLLQKQQQQQMARQQQQQQMAGNQGSQQTTPSSKPTTQPTTGMTEKEAAFAADKEKVVVELMNEGATREQATAYIDQKLAQQGLSPK